MINDGIRITDKDIHSFLMIGQSNMAGRGEFGEIKPIDNYKCYMFRMGRFQRMREPINPDRAIFEGTYHSGVSLGSSFADEYTKRFGMRVGMIPCADGGTKLDEWMPGTVLYDHAVFMTRLAMRSSRFSGILWHQGESDCNFDEDLYAYKDKFLKMISSLRRDLDAENLPLIIGELSENIGEAWKLEDRPEKMNRLFYEIAKEIPHCSVASAKGLTLKPDGIHFDSKSLNIFGRRYLEEYAKISLK